MIEWLKKFIFPVLFMNCWLMTSRTLRPPPSRSTNLPALSCDVGIHSVPARLLHLLLSEGLDPTAATRSVTKIPISSPPLAKNALEAPAFSIAALLGGFKNDSFYLDSPLSWLLIIFLKSVSRTN